jgi:hypothetical protein
MNLFESTHRRYMDDVFEDWGALFFMDFDASNPKVLNFGDFPGMKVKPVLYYSSQYSL